MATSPQPAPEELRPEEQVAAEPRPRIHRRVWSGIKRGGRAVAAFWRDIRPGPEAARGAVYGGFAAVAVLAIAFGAAVHTGLGIVADVGLALILGAILICLTALLVWLLFTIGRKLPRWTSGFVIGAAVVFGATFPPSLGIPMGALVVLAAGTLGATIASSLRGFGQVRPVKKWVTLGLMVLSVAAVVGMISFAVSEGTDEALVKAVKPQGPPPPTIRAANPGLAGPFRVKTLTYGSGNDKWRPEYRNVAIKTPTVDATGFFPDFKNWKAKARRWYWGFDFDKLPLNARVWYPDGPGPFPLVLIVHGNHQMELWSDPGYAYLGQLLASRGFILASIDENFLNGGWAGDPPNEKAPRGWMLLEHLRLWRGWSSKSGNPFSGKVDMDRIALMGHSRGGEAAATATLFNKLAYYPDDATIKFAQYGFNIRSVVAVAPADGQYKPAGERRKLEDVNYFVLQGGHDSDVSLFLGSKQFERVRFTGDGPWFKSELYIYRANHGQFNTTWGRSDWGEGPQVWFLNRKPIMDPGDQRRIAGVYISAFLEATLNGRREYVPLFRDVSTGRDWLPSALCLNRFEDATWKRVADFSEDVDVTTGTMPGTKISGEHFSTWKEGRVPFRDGDHERNGVFLGWNRKTEKPVPQPVYTVTLPENAGTGPQSVLALALSATDDDPKVPKGAKDRTDKEKKKHKPKDPDPIDFTVEVGDANGKLAAFPLSRFGALQPPLKVRMTKLAKIDQEAFKKAAEPVFQTFELPLREFAAASPGLDVARVRTVRLRMDKVEKGSILISEIAVREDWP